MSRLPDDRVWDRRLWPSAHYAPEQGWVNGPYGVPWDGSRYPLYLQAIANRTGGTGGGEPSMVIERSGMTPNCRQPTTCRRHRGVPRRRHPGGFADGAYGAWRL
jgi:hypothetical protein